MKIDFTNPLHLLVFSVLALITLVSTVWSCDDTNTGLRKFIWPVSVGLISIICFLTSLRTMISRLLHS